MVGSFDRRLHAARDDLADERLRGKFKSERYVAGEAGRVAVPVASIHCRPEHSAGVDTQFLFGDAVRIFERRAGWCWVQGEADGYTGYVEAAALALPGPVVTHSVIAPRSFVYPEPELRLPPIMALSMGTSLAIGGHVEQRGTRYAALAGGGYVFADHVAPINAHAADYVAIAERLIGTPYLWGGASAFGIDCSGLVQLALRMAGQRALRDSDMQEASLGDILAEGEPAERGDLLFWKGHVAIIAGEDRLLHANGFSMDVSCEPMQEALARIAAGYGPPRLRRRIKSSGQQKGGPAQ